jgi:hypothetical protein
MPSDNPEIDIILEDLKTSGLFVCEGIFISPDLLSKLEWEVLVSSDPYRILRIFSELLSTYKTDSFDISEVEHDLYRFTDLNIKEGQRSFEVYCYILIYLYYINKAHSVFLFLQRYLNYYIDEACEDTFQGMRGIYGICAILPTVPIE